METQLPSKDGYMVLENTAGQWDDEFLTDDTTGGPPVMSSMAPGGLVSAVGVTTGSSSTILTICLVVLAVVIAIVALFALAVFIDFRQQKIADLKKLSNIKKKYPRVNLPRCRRARDTETSTITEDAQPPGQSRPPLETIVEVV